MVFDRVYNVFARKAYDKTNEDRYWTKEIIKKGKSNEVWICFLGWRTSIEVAKKLCLKREK